MGNVLSALFQIKLVTEWHIGLHSFARYFFYCIIYNRVCQNAEFWFHSLKKFLEVIPCTPMAGEVTQSMSASTSFQPHFLNPGAASIHMRCVDGVNGGTYSSLLRWNFLANYPLHINAWWVIRLHYSRFSDLKASIFGLSNKMPRQRNA